MGVSTQTFLQLCDDCVIFAFSLHFLLFSGTRHNSFRVENTVFASAISNSDDAECFSAIVCTFLGWISWSIHYHRSAHIPVRILPFYEPASLVYSPMCKYRATFICTIFQCSGVCHSPNIHNWYWSLLKANGSFFCYSSLLSKESVHYSYVVRQLPPSSFILVNSWSWPNCKMPRYSPYFFIFTTFWRHLSIGVQPHGQMESVCWLDMVLKRVHWLIHWC